MKAQSGAIASGETDWLLELDYEFQKLLCQFAQQAFAFDLIAASKAQVDRLCMLALTSKEAMELLYADHQDLLEAIMSCKAKNAEETLSLHLTRLTPTIESICITHRAYFDD